MSSYSVTLQSETLSKILMLFSLAFFTEVCHTKNSTIKGEMWHVEILEPKPIAIEKIKSLNSEEFNCPRRGVVQDPNNCTYFYICSPYGTFYHQRCPRGFNFDPVRLMCDFPERVPCYTNQSVDQND